MIDEENNPPHYNNGAMETIDVIKASMSKEEFRGYLKGNIVKYISRHMYKDEDVVKDVRKANWYMNRLIEELENE